MSDNTAQIEFWNGKAGETWVRAQQRLDGMLVELSEIAVAKADPKSGERVIDVGCGCGTTTLALAARGATVWGIDISVPMLAWAKERATGLDNIVFSQADAMTQTLTADHQLVFSRFGVMFFAEPVAAFANLRSGLSESGRLVFICWQSPADNPWVSIAGRAIKPYLPAVEAVDPRAPGPFAFADADYVGGILSQAGFADVIIESVTADQHVGDDLEAALQSQVEFGPLARVLAELDRDNKIKALAAVREAFKPYLTEAGVNLGAAAWLVSANKN